MQQNNEMTNYTELAQRAKELAEKATAGPWVSERESVGAPCVYTQIPRPEDRTDLIAEVYEYRGQDTEFIAASRDLVPQLADAVLELSKALANAESLRQVHITTEPPIGKTTILEWVPNL